MNTALGIATLASLLLAQAGPSSRPASQAAPTGGKITDLYGEVTVIYELGESTLRAKESWRFRNEGAYRLAPEHFELSLPEDLKRARLDEDSAPFQLNDSKITLSAPLSPGEHNLGFNYEFPLDSGSADLERRFTYRVGGVRLIMESTPGLELTTSIASSKRTRDLNGIVFAIWDVEAISPGETLRIEVSGLPSRGTWMRNVMLVACVLVLLWMVLSLRKPQEDGEDERHVPQSVMTAGARKTRLLQALSVLDEDRDSNRLDEKQYQRRQKALLKDLATTIRKQKLEEDIF